MGKNIRKRTDYSDLIDRCDIFSVEEGVRTEFALRLEGSMWEKTFPCRVF